MFFVSALSRKRIGILSMLGVYIVLFVGMFIAFVALIAEIFWKRRARQILFDKVRKQRFVTVLSQYDILRYAESASLPYDLGNDLCDLLLLNDTGCILELRIPVIANYHLHC